MKTLFIDTNVLLSFYHLTSEDLEELRKLVALIDTTKIELVLTEQIEDEFNRNRAAKIADAMKKLQDARFKIAFPAFAKDYPGYDELRTLLDKAGKKHAELVETITEDAIKGDLKADALVADLFQKATVIPVSDEIYLDALKRVRRGNPPGKENSLGDAINWECLLAKIDDGTDVHLVSEDKDYRSQLTPEFSDFLNHEWKTRKNSERSPARSNGICSSKTCAIPEASPPLTLLWQGCSSTQIFLPSRLRSSYKLLGRTIRWVGS